MMGKAAVDAAKAVGYVGAGTVEFIANQDGTFYFMEMNTRLQVEHPVTEMITGLDLVEWQLKVGAGETLPLRQEQLAIRGHALEARIYAEDPDKGFLPSVGRLIHLAPPAETLNVRVDTGVEQDDEISPHYDPMIAKLIVWDETRERALARMLQALADYRVVGVSNNIGFLSRLVACPAFAQADLDTGLIERERTFLFPETSEPPAEAWLVAALGELIRDQQYAAAEASASPDPHSPWHARDGWRVNGIARREIKLRAGEVEKVVTAGLRRRGLPARIRRPAQHRGRAFRRRQRTARGPRRPAHQRHRGVGQRKAPCLHRRRLLRLRRHRPPVPCRQRRRRRRRIDRAHAGQGDRADRAGRRRIEKGAPLLILEAMKMEHTIAAPVAGVVKAFRFNVGEQVSDGAELVEFEADKK
jgi:3-methylcrotonyl-CoA carboxylase alpha subunit